MVLGFHVSLQGVAANHADQIVLRSVWGLWSGVDLFFVLSGFLITGILLDSRSHEHYFRNFYVRRTLRIFPLYYGVLLALLVVVPFLKPAAAGLDTIATLRANQVWFWTYATNIKVAITHSWDGVVAARLNHFWSLAVEEQFYLVWPLIVLLAGRRRLIWTCGAIVVGAMIVRAWTLYMDPGSATSGAYTQHVAGYVLLPARADTLAIGAIVACLIRSPEGKAFLARWASRVGWGCAAALTAILVWKGTIWEYDPVIQIVGYPLIALLYAALIVKAINPAPSRLTRGFRWSPLRRVGRYAYAIYVFHYPLIYYLGAAGYGPDRYFRNSGSILPGVVVMGVIAFALSFAAAAISWRYYEAPILGLSRFFRGSERRAPAAPSVVATA